MDLTETGWEVELIVQFWIGTRGRLKYMVMKFLVSCNAGNFLTS